MMGADRTQQVAFRCIARLALAASALCAYLALPGTALAEGDMTQKGLNLSQQHCSRCHIVAKDRFAGIASSPSFKIMIEVLEDWEDRFATFMARNPHPAHMRLEGDDERPDDLPSTIKEVILTHDEVEAILAYVDQMAVELGRK